MIALDFGRPADSCVQDSPVSDWKEIGGSIRASIPYIALRDVDISTCCAAVLSDGCRLQVHISAIIMSTSLDCGMLR